MFKYNVCFLKSKDKVFILICEKAPINGVWNGVGGKNEIGETADEGAIHEVFEETGFNVNQYYSKGIIRICKYGSDHKKDGL